MHLIQLLLQIAAILLVGRFLTRLMRRLGQPAVIAEIVAGIALGPSLLGWIWPAGMAALFPAESMAGLGLVSQLGLVFFMFLVGLEFDPRLLQGQLRASVLISNAGILVPFLLGALLAVPLHPLLAPEGVGLVPFLLFLGTAMSVTAFPVLARILTERRLIRTRVGAVALASAAVDDVSAWCLLALVVGIASSGGVAAAAVTTAIALLYSAFVWFGVRPMLARVGPRQGQAISTEVIGLVMLLVVLSAATTEWIGIHALFGAFLVGAAMPRAAGLSAVLADKLEDFVTVVLLPLFFAYSGLRTQIGLLSDAEDWALCAAIVAVATLGKFGGTSLAGRLSGLDWRDASALGVLMNTRGLMELVVLNVGLDLGVISPRLFAMMVIMALVTTWVTSPLLARLYPPARALGDLGPPPLPASSPGPLVCVSDPAAAPPLVALTHRWLGPERPTSWALHLTPTDRPHDYLREGAGPGADPPLEAIGRAAADLGLRFEPLAFPSADPAADIDRVARLKGVPLLLLGIHRSTFGLDSFGGVVGRLLADPPALMAVLVPRGATFERVRGGADPAVRAFVARLVAGGAREVEQDPDLDVLPWRTDAAIPEGPASLCYVRGPA